MSGSPYLSLQRTEAIDRRELLEITSYDVSLRAAALHFPTTHPAVTTVLIGCATAAEVRENVELWRQPLPAELWTALDACH